MKTILEDNISYDTKINEIKKSGKYNMLDDINLLKRGIKNVIKKS